MSYELVIERSCGGTSREAPSIAAVLMVRNEAALIERTLASVADHVDCLIVLDTGSEDDTIGIIDRFAAEHELSLHLIAAPFVDFATSRNVLLDYADTRDAAFLLLLDANDELRGGAQLRKFAHEAQRLPQTAHLVTQIWWTGRQERYYNTRFLRARQGWRYRGAVHEWLERPTPDGSVDVATVPAPETIILYQDRTREAARSSDRYVRDRAILLEELERNPGDPRTLFYLAQTCACLEEYEDAYRYNSLRIEAQGGLDEERFHACLRNGVLAGQLGRPWEEQLGWLMRAFEHSERVEPLIQIGEHYIARKQWHVAYPFIHHACRLPFPEAAALYVNIEDYAYQRWHLMGAVGFQTGHYEEGLRACERALAMGRQPALDETNLRLYRQRVGIGASAGSRDAGASPPAAAFAPDGSPLRRP